VHDLDGNLIAIRGQSSRMTRSAPEAILATIAHDVRSPLVVISATASTLRETAPPELHASLDKILLEAQRIDRMLANRTTAARLARDQVMNREWITVEELASNALVRMGALLGERRIELAIETGAVAHVEARLVELAIANLVDNAIRHAGGVLVIAGRRETTQVVIEVSDAGPGIATDTEDRPSLVSGLAVCRAIASAHGGSLALVARQPGTLVRLVLPYGEPRPTFEAE
jgi:two-component system, OmpR family, sensor histidine kinase KdpD